MYATFVKSRQVLVLLIYYVALAALHRQLHAAIALIDVKYTYFAKYMHNEFDKSAAQVAACMLEGKAANVYVPYTAHALA